MEKSGLIERVSMVFSEVEDRTRKQTGCTADRIIGVEGRIEDDGAR